MIPVASFPFFRASLHYHFGNLIKRLLLVILFLVFEKFHLIYKSIFSNWLYFLWAPFQCFFDIFAQILGRSSSSIVLISKIIFINILSKIELNDLLWIRFLEILLLCPIVILLLIRINILVRFYYLINWWVDSKIAYISVKSIYLLISLLG